MCVFILKVKYNFNLMFVHLTVVSFSYGHNLLTKLITEIWDSGDIAVKMSDRAKSIRKVLQ